MTDCEITTATAPMSHRLRGDATTVTALAITRSPATSHATPVSREMGRVSCGQLGIAKGLRKPHHVDESVSCEQNGDDPANHHRSTSRLEQGSCRIRVQTLTGKRCGSPRIAPSPGGKIPRIVGTFWHLFVKEITPGRRCCSDCQAAFARRYAPKTGIPCAYRTRYCLPGVGSLRRLRVGPNQRRHDFNATRSARSGLGGGWFRSRRWRQHTLWDVGMTWYRYGQIPPATGDEMDPLLDRFMPEYDVAERHHVRVMAPPEITLSAAADTDLQRSAVIRAIFGTLGSWGAGRGA